MWWFIPSSRSMRAWAGPLVPGKPTTYSCPVRYHRYFMPRAVRSSPFTSTVFHTRRGVRVRYLQWVRRLRRIFWAGSWTPGVSSPPPAGPRSARSSAASAACWPARPAATDFPGRASSPAHAASASPTPPRSGGWRGPSSPGTGTRLAAPTFARGETAAEARQETTNGLIVDESWSAHELRIEWGSSNTHRRV